MGARLPLRKRMADESSKVPKGPGPYIEFGRWLRSLREGRLSKKDRSQPRAAMLAQSNGLTLINQGRITHIERGWNREPDPELLRQFASLYHVSYEEIVSKWVAFRFGNIARDDSAHAKNPTAADEPLTSPVTGDRVSYRDAIDSTVTGETDGHTAQHSAGDRLQESDETARLEQEIEHDERQLDIFDAHLRDIAVALSALTGRHVRFTVSRRDHPREQESPERDHGRSKLHHQAAKRGRK